MNVTAATPATAAVFTPFRIVFMRSSNVRNLIRQAY